MEEVKEYKYLGLHLASTGSVQTAREPMYKVTLKALYKLRRCLNITQIKPKLAIHLFDSLISPVALYGCKISNYFNITKRMEGQEDKIFDKVLGWQQERLHLNYLRYILGVNAKEAGRYPMFIKAIKQMWKFHCRCKNYDTNSLLFKHI